MMLKGERMVTPADQIAAEKAIRRTLPYQKLVFREFVFTYQSGASSSQAATLSATARKAHFAAPHSQRKDFDKWTKRHNSNHRKKPSFWQS